jgi:hypothetical protein
MFCKSTLGFFWRQLAREGACDEAGRSLTFFLTTYAEPLYGVWCGQAFQNMSQ